MSADQRRAERRAISAQFSARDASGAGTLVFTSEDVSAGGVFLRSELLLELGEALALEFDLPGGMAIKTQARVAWVRRFPEAGQAAGMGVEFVVLPDEERAALNAWLAT